VKGWGHYVGTYMAWGVNNTGWGRGRDQVLHRRRHGVPDHLWHGTEDYFCGSYNFENKETKQYQEFSDAVSGCRR